MGRYAAVHDPEGSDVGLWENAPAGWAAACLGHSPLHHAPLPPDRQALAASSSRTFVTSKPAMLAGRRAAGQGPPERSN